MDKPNSELDRLVKRRNRIGVGTFLTVMALTGISLLLSLGDDYKEYSKYPLYLIFPVAFMLVIIRSLNEKISKQKYQTIEQENLRDSDGETILDEQSKAYWRGVRYTTISYFRKMRTNESGTHEWGIFRGENHSSEHIELHNGIYVTKKDLHGYLGTQWRGFPKSVEKEFLILIVAALLGFAYSQYFSRNEDINLYGHSIVFLGTLALILLLIYYVSPRLSRSRFLTQFYGPRNKVLEKSYFTTARIRGAESVIANLENGQLSVFVSFPKVDIEKVKDPRELERLAQQISQSWPG